jgi:hypothetical protein
MIIYEHAVVWCNEKVVKKKWRGVKIELNNCNITHAERNKTISLHAHAHVCVLQKQNIFQISENSSIFRMLPHCVFGRPRIIDFSAFGE